jgi:hypothetical protein
LFIFFFFYFTILLSYKILLYSTPPPPPPNRPVQIKVVFVQLVPKNIELGKRDAD